jgi:hypothetical protein
MPDRGTWSLAALALCLASCTYWEPYPPVRPAGPSSLPSSLRVSPDTGASVVLVEPFVRADTLLGRVGRDTVGVRLKEIRELQRQRVHGLRTLGLVAGVSAVWITVGLYGGGLE